MNKFSISFYFYLVSLLLVNSKITEAKINNVKLNKVSLEDSRWGHNISEVRFLLWTRSNSENDQYYTLELNNLENLENSPFNENLRTYFLIHGWRGRGDTSWILNIKTDLLVWSDCNVISVDWKTLAQTLDYFRAVKNVYKVAELNSQLIDWLVGNTALTTDNIHITGHSLGGQMAGITGKYVTSGKIDRVTGLDPAGPSFYTKSSNEKIAPTDASFVDVIHTNRGTLAKGCVGLYAPTGHVDFYPNGGRHQPGCADNIFDSMADMFSSCSHSRSHELFRESILAGQSADYPLEFWSWPCDSYKHFKKGKCPTCGKGCLTMGFHVNRNCTGAYYLNTNEDSPFAKGLEQN